MSRNFIPTINISSLLDCRFDSKNSLKMIKKIEKACKEVGFFQIIGHGIGKIMHEKPEMPNYGRKGTGKKFKEGMVVAIEPMINMGTHKIIQHSDGWTITTKDNLASAHFEHNIAIINGKPEILSTFKYIYESLNISSNEEKGFHNYFKLL